VNVDKLDYYRSNIQTFTLGDSICVRVLNIEETFALRNRRVLTRCRSAVSVAAGILNGESPGPGDLKFGIECHRY